MSDQNYLAISQLPGVQNFLLDAFGRLDRMGVSPRICIVIAAEIQCMIEHRLKATPELMGGRSVAEELAEARRQLTIKYTGTDFPQDKEDAGLGQDGGPKHIRAEDAPAILDALASARSLLAEFDIPNGGVWSDM